MLCDLLRRFPLVGMRKQALLELLGPPCETAHFANWDIKYRLGPTLPFPIDSEWLVLRVDQSDVVTSYAVLPD